MDNRHDPIIERSVFERVQEIKAKTKRRVPKPMNGGKHLLSDYLYCTDRGKKLWYHTNTLDKDIHYFSCSNYTKDCCGTWKSRHYIRAYAVDQVVKMELRRLAGFLRDDEETFAEILSQKTNKDILREQKHLKDELNKTIARNEAVSELYEKLYEDNAIGKVMDEWFMQLSHKYEVERLEPKTKVSDLRQKLSAIGEMRYGKDAFISAIRKFMQMDTLTAPLLKALIDHIDVYETEGVGKTEHNEQ